MNHNIKAYSFIVFFSALLLGRINALSQTLPAISTVHSPEVTAFNHDIETPVSMYTGVPTISIPLYNIEIKGVSVPITLNYNAGGIKVDQESTAVGLGWSLNYGGQISRVVRGAPDEFYLLPQANNSSSAYGNISSYMNMPGITDPFLSRYNALSLAKNQGNDYMPDNFYYSLPGYSGRFMFSQALGKFVLFPKDDIAISYQLSSNSSTLINKWTLNLPNGISVDYGNGAISEDFPVGVSKPTAPSAWNIKTIRNTDNDSISFTYQNYYHYVDKLNPEKASFLYTISLATDGNYPAQEMSDQTILTPDAASWSSAQQISATEYENIDAQIAMISFPAGKVIFNGIATGGSVSGSLQQINDGGGTPLITSIQVFDKIGNLIKQINFNYQNLRGNDGDVIVKYGSVINANQFLSDTTVRYYRPMLTGVNINGQSYSFSYYTYPKMPSKYSVCQDHWGFYNGINNGGLFPLIPSFEPDWTSLFNGGNRKVDPTVSNVFSLKSVTYPEGGSTQFVYEGNTAKSNNIPSAMLNYYQDNHIPNKTAEINISGTDRLTSSLTPDSTDGSGNRYFIHYFTPNGIPYLNDGYGWICSTNFGLSSPEESNSNLTNNASCALYGLVNSQWTLIRQFNTHPSASNFSSGQSTLMKIDYLNDNGVGASRFKMVVELSYAGTSKGSTLENQPWSLDFKVNWREQDSTAMVNIGGVRVKDIYHYLPGQIIAAQQHYDYTDVNSSAAPINFSSGNVTSFPLYFQCQSQTTANPQSGSWTTSLYMTLNSQSCQPLETTSGSFAGYDCVSETNVDFTNAANNLKTISHFQFSPPYYSQFYTYENMGSYEPAEWTRGKLLTKQYYQGKSIIRQEDYSYYWQSPYLMVGQSEDYADEINTDLISFQYLARISYSSGTSQPRDYLEFPGWNGGNQPISYPYAYIPGIPNNTDLNNFNLGWVYGAQDYSVDPSITVDGGFHCVGSCPVTNITLPHFFHYTGFDKPMTKIVTTYDGGIAVRDTENYYYEHTPNLYQRTRIQTSDGKGNILETRSSYPIDSASGMIYQQMISQHILDPVIKSAKYVNGNFIESQNISYAKWPTGTTTSGIFAPSQNSTMTAATRVPDVRTIYINYDTYGNLLSAKRPSGPTVSVQYGYNNQYIVAHVENATINGGKDYFFDSFEEGDGNNSDSKTGHYSYSGNYSQSLTGLDNGVYICSYWQKQNGVWILQINPVKISSGSYTINISGQIDDVRFYTAGASMSTYTYDPLVGLTSQTDSKNEITYYEYDSMQRLINIRDKDRNIIKHISYHYYSDPIPNYSGISIENITGTAVTVNWTLPSNSATASAILQYSDNSTGQIYTKSISSAQTGQTTIVVPAANRTYTFMVIQTLSTGQIINSMPLVVNVPAY